SVQPLAVCSTYRFDGTVPACTSALSLDDALPICGRAGTEGGGCAPGGRSRRRRQVQLGGGGVGHRQGPPGPPDGPAGPPVPGVRDRKSTRLNSSHVKISYAVFCLKKKT